MKKLFVSILLLLICFSSFSHVSHKEVRKAKKEYELQKKFYHHEMHSHESSFDKMHSLPTESDSAKLEIIEMYRLNWIGLKRIRHDQYFWIIKK